MKKAYFHSLLRLFKNHIIRFFSISAIFAITIGLIAGIGDSSFSFFKTEEALYKNENVHDAVIISKEEDVMSASNHMTLLFRELEKFSEEYGINELERWFSFDLKDENDPTDNFAIRYAFLDINEHTIDKFSLVTGRLPENDNEVVVENKNDQIKEYEIGYKFIEPVTNQECTVVGVVNNPTIFARKDEPSNSLKDPNNNDSYRYLNSVFYIQNPMLANAIGNQIYATFAGKTPTNLTNNEYKKKVDAFKETINNIELYSFGETIKISEIAETISLYENYSFNLLDKDAGKIEVVARIFSIVFILVLLLMVYSTMSRLFDEERSSIAVLKTLGYRKFFIAFRYLVFVFLAGLLGIGIAVAPAYIVNSIVTIAIKNQLNLPYVKIVAIGYNFLVISIIAFIVSLILTGIVGFVVAKKKPVELLVSKTPKVGKKILLEKIKFIWNKLSFKYKSTYRNIFLFKSKLIMTVLCIILSSTMVFVSFAMLDNSMGENGSPLTLISITLLIFSALLCALIIYNITNINISERQREIATLMVLGYNDKETVGYIVREIYIVVIISALIGLPIACGGAEFILTYCEFGSLAHVNWWSYLLTPVITIIFAFLATILLRSRITHTNMNDSLKILE